MRKTFVMRGKTASGETEVLNFGKYKQGYAYKMTEFVLYPSTGIGSALNELCGTVTAGKTAVAPTDPDFNDDALIATALSTQYSSPAYPPSFRSVVDDTFVITQNLILMVQDTDASGSQDPINWQCRFESVKMTGAEEAAVNYKQFAISDE
jgi:hypothetical protein